MNKIFFGDCVKTMRKWPEKRVQMCVTSPPYYGLRDYKHDDQLGLEESPEKYIENMVKVFREVHRVMKDDGTLWLNIGDSYNNYRPGKGQRQGKQSLAGNKSSEVEICNKRGLKLEGLKEKDLIGIPWMLAFALRADGWYLRQDIIWHKPSCMPESVLDRCTKAHEYIFLLSKNKNYYFDNEAIKTKVLGMWGIRNRKVGGTKYSTGEHGLSPPNGLEKEYTMANKRSVWSVNPKPYKGSHFATYPPKLIIPCILAGSKPGDIVLDPFIGSGTTAMVAKQYNRRYVGCELNPAYEVLQKQRLCTATPRLFDY